MDLYEIRRKGVDWCFVTQYRGKWSVIVDRVMKFGFQKTVPVQALRGSGG